MTYVVQNFINFLQIITGWKLYNQMKALLDIICEYDLFCNQNFLMLRRTLINVYEKNIRTYVLHHITQNDYNTPKSVHSSHC